MLVSNIPDVLWKIDRNNYIIYISENIEAISGYTPDEEYEMGPDLNWIDSIHPDDVKEYVAASDALFEKDRPFNIEYRLRRKDGEWVWIHDRAVATYDEDGKKYASGLLSDITERKQAEEETKRLKEKYESVIKHTPDTLYSGLPDETCTMTFISERYREWTGYSPQEFYQDPWAWPKTVHPEDRERELKTYIESCQKKRAYLSEYLIVHKDTGQVRWVRDHGVPVTDEKGTLILIDGIITDITERKQVEEALQKSEEFSSNLLNNSPNPIVVINSDLSVGYVNPAMERMTGFSSRGLLGKKPPYPWWTEEIRHKVSKDLQEALSEGISKREEFFQKRNGERFWVEVTAAPVTRNDGSTYLLVNWTNITEQKRLRDDMQFYIREITRVQEQERKRISRELHDETAQSLADLYTDVDMIIMKEQLSENVVRRLEQLRLKIDSMLEEVRRFSHELRPGLLDQFGLIPSLESLTVDVNTEEKISCRLEVTGFEQRLSSEAEALLFRITQEALRNIRKHAKATEAIVRVDFSRDKVRLSITDNGIGFKVPEILSGFARRGKLGLMGMQERVHLLNGSLKVKSTVGKGTTITVEYRRNQVTALAPAEVVPEKAAPFA
ncbi:MAG: PAS domain S-box protein [Dehalococcoidales bacterium]|nr:PAS domain S-box protein [Dehalococcoidales bacterium]